VSGGRGPDLTVGGGLPEGPALTWEVERWRALVGLPEFTWEGDWVLALINCESSGNPNVQGVEWHDFVPWPDGDGVLERYEFNGLLQVWDGSFDPLTNLRQGYAKWMSWQRGDVPDPWPNCP